MHKINQSIYFNLFPIFNMYISIALTNLCSLMSQTIKTVLMGSSVCDCEDVMCVCVSPNMKCSLAKMCKTRF